MLNAGKLLLHNGRDLLLYNASDLLLYNDANLLLNDICDLLSDYIADLLLHDGGDHLAEGVHDFILHHALDLTTYCLTYLLLHRSFDLISNGLHDLFLHSDLQLLLNDFLDFFGYSLPYLPNVRYLVDSPLKNPEALVNRIVHAGNGLQDCLQPRLLGLTALISVLARDPLLCQRSSVQSSVVDLSARGRPRRVAPGGALSSSCDDGRAVAAIDRSAN